MKFFNCLSNALDSSFVLKTAGTFPMSHVFEVKFVGKFVYYMVILIQ